MSSVRWTTLYCLGSSEETGYKVSICPRVKWLNMRIYVLTDHNLAQRVCLGLWNYYFIPESTLYGFHCITVLGRVLHWLTHLCRDFGSRQVVGRGSACAGRGRPSWRRRPARSTRSAWNKERREVRWMRFIDFGPRENRAFFVLSCIKRESSIVLFPPTLLQKRT